MQFELDIITEVMTSSSELKTKLTDHLKAWTLQTWIPTSQSLFSMLSEKSMT